MGRACGPWPTVPAARRCGQLLYVLEATQEAVTIYRELAAAMPDRYRPNLASSVNNLADSSEALGCGPFR